ncbi:hypothetical protein [Membranihabitans maritimus]|uniref:hypothetical protein n=1 Tax=Membranihabitans maritimus TaxID=2904244 RepID=UPI001F270A65|nr:hypothetical protein [Membranihabitans maritimus]
MKAISRISTVLLIGAAWVFIIIQVAGPLLPKTDICKRKALTSVPVDRQDQPLTNWPFDSVPASACQISIDIPVEQRLLNSLRKLFEFKTPKVDTSYYSFIIIENPGEPTTPPPDSIS